MNIMTSSSMILQLVTLLAIIIASVTQINSAPHPECQTTCGDLTIPFPFGTTSECCLDVSFLINCNNSYNPPKPFLNLSNTEVLDISLDGLLRVTTPIPSDFHDKISSQIDATIPEFFSSNFWLSTTPNKLVAVSLGTYTLVEGSEEWKPVSAGCKSFFERDHDVLNTNSRVEDFLDDISVDTYPTNKDNLNPYDFYGCALESSDFQVSSWDIRNIKAISIVFAWSIGNVTCLVSRENLVDYACQSPRSTCSDSSHGLGYNCNCLAGFQGSPYLVDGCQDIDECIEPNPCERTCTNLNGSYSCSCPEGFGGDGKKNGSGCHQLKSQIKGYTSLYITSGFHRLESQIRGSVLFYITFGFLIPGVGSSWIFWRSKQKKLVKLRKNLFKSNGGLILEDMLERRGTLSIFTAEELKKATNNYAENNIISRDHHSVGVVYRGELLIEGVNKLVTVKRCSEVEQCQVKVFVSKLVTFSLMHHKNVVKVLGCCLETPIPLLVYEFISVKTLHDYIHEGHSRDFLSWDILLKIATETAGALSYMHSSNSLPIIHGNLNSSNILIHLSHTAKVQGFALEGSYYSPEVPFNLSEKREYLDPEYLSSGTLTEKSDVYSFGVVLAEILTGKYVFENAGGQHFAQYLASSSTRDVHIRIPDHRLKIDYNFEQLTQVGKLAERCLSVSSTERPSMKEVAVKLESVISTSSSAKAIKLNSRLPTKVCSLLRRNKSL